MDTERLAEAVRAIQASYNSGEDKHVKRAIKALEASVQGEETDIVIDYADVKEESAPFIISGQDWLDAFFLGGIRRGELILVGGESYMGKTHMLVWIAAQYLISGMSVLHYNGEDILHDVAQLYGRATKPYLDDASIVFKRLKFVDAVTQTFSAESINKSTQRLVDGGYSPDVIVVDHLDLLYMSSQDWTAVSSTTRALKFLAKQFNAVVITASQYHFDPDAAKKGLPGKSRLFGGKVSKFQHLDLFLSLDYRDSIGTHISLEKAKGRRKTVDTPLNWVVECDLENMDFLGQPS